MPTVTVPLGLTKPTVGGDKDVWGQYWNDNADTLNAIHIDDGTGTSVGMHVGTGQVLKIDGGTSEEILPGLLDTQTLRLRDTIDTTKIVDFKVDQVATGTVHVLSAPDASGTIATQEWVNLKMPTGTVLSGYYGSAAPAGFVLLIGRTIGDAASGATERANADTVNLYTLFWSLGWAPIGGYGANAAADFAAHKPMQLPDHRGRVMAALDRDGSGNLTAAGSSTIRGTGLGQSTVQYNVVAGTFSGSGTGTAATFGMGMSFETANAGAVANGSGPYALHHWHTLESDADVSVTVSGTTSGTTSDTRTNAQPTVMVDTVIAL